MSESPRQNRPAILTRLIKPLAALVVLKTVAASYANFRGYFPPDFTSDFLLGRQGHFFGWYRWAFYAHILAGPPTLVLGMLLVTDPFRRRWPAWHRRFGKAQVALVLGVVAPSGLAMAYHAATGPVAGAGFATLALATAYATWRGWSAAVGRRFAEHRVWMQRSFALLLSAVVLRVLGGAAEVTGLLGTYPIAAWAGWILPLAVLEAWRRRRPRPGFLTEPRPSGSDQTSR